MSTPQDPLSPTLACVVLPLEAADHYEAIEELANALAADMQATDGMRISAAAIARESLACTHLGHDTALPHARLPNFDRFLFGIGLSAKGIPWGSENKIAHIILLSAVPQSANTAYLGFVRKLILAIKDEPRRQALLKAGEPEAIHHWVQQHL